MTRQRTIGVLPFDGIAGRVMLSTILSTYLVTIRKGLLGVLRMLVIIVFHVWYGMGKGTMAGRKEEDNLAELDCIAVCLSRDLDDLDLIPSCR